MKKTQTVVRNGEMRPAYDFRSMKGGVRGKYVERVRKRTNILLIEPTVAEAFPTERRDARTRREDDLVRLAAERHPLARQGQ